MYNDASVNDTPITKKRDARVAKRRVYSSHTEGITNQFDKPQNLSDSYGNGYNDVIFEECDSTDRGNEIFLRITFLHSPFVLRVPRTHIRVYRSLWHTAN